MLKLQYAGRKKTDDDTIKNLRPSFPSQAGTHANGTRDRKGQLLDSVSQCTSPGANRVLSFQIDLPVGH